MRIACGLFGDLQHAFQEKQDGRRSRDEWTDLDLPNSGDTNLISSAWDQVHVSSRPDLSDALPSALTEIACELSFGIYPRNLEFTFHGLPARIRRKTPSPLLPCCEVIHPQLVLYLYPTIVVSLLVPFYIYCVLIST